MKQIIEVANPYKEEHIKLLEQYEKENNLTHATSEYLKQAKSLMSEVDYKQLEQEKPEIVKTLFLQQEEKIMTAVHLLGEKDRKVCRINIDNTSTAKLQEKLLQAAEQYAFNLGMEEIMILQDEGSRISSNYFKIKGFDNLGKEGSLQIYLKSKPTQKSFSHQI